MTEQTNPQLTTGVFLTFIVGALAIRSAIWFIFNHDPTLYPQPDSFEYLRLATEIFEQHSFTSFSRTPTYPLYLGILKYLTGWGVSGLIFLQILLSLANIYLIWQISKYLISRQAQLIMLALYSLDFASAMGANYLLTETLVTTLILLACLSFTRLAHSKEPVLPALGCGASLSLLILCRPIAILLPIVFATYWWFYCSPPKRNSFLPGLVILLVGFTLPFAWMARNHEQTGEYFLSTISSINLYEYRAAWNIAYRDKPEFFTVQQEFQRNKQDLRAELELNEAQLATHVSAEALRIIINNPIEAALQGGRGFLNLYLGIFNSAINDLVKVIGVNSSPIIVVLIKTLVVCHLILIYLGCLWFGLHVLPHQKNELVTLSLIVITYFTLLSIGAETYARFRIPITPFIIIISALGWERFIEKRNNAPSI